jgi:hypothetical protein
MASVAIQKMIASEMSPQAVFLAATRENVNPPPSSEGDGGSPVLGLVSSWVVMWMLHLRLFANSALV